MVQLSNEQCQFIRGRFVSEASGIWESFALTKDQL